mmetsp:Transcript_45131/g.79421  ORF Transcript_45131/g.79421 Transcript_45131/m.79421 type:complete len:521 (+) Transcript_45131:96-1658(+)
MPVSDSWAPRVIKVSKACVDFGTALLTKTNGEAAAALDEMKALLQDGVGTLKLCQTGLAVLSGTVKESIKVDFQEDKSVELSGTKAWMFKNKSYGLIWLCKDFSELCKQADDKVSEAAAELLLCRIHMTRAPEPDAPAAIMKQAKKAIKLFQALGDEAGEAEGLAMLMDGNTLLAVLSPFKDVQERVLNEAVALGPEALELCKKTGSTSSEVKVQISLANANMGFQYLNSADREHLNAAEAAAEAAVSLCRKTKNPDMEVVGLEVLMRVRSKLEGPSEVERIADETARRWKRQSYKSQQAWAQHCALEAVIAVGDYENAQQRASDLQQLYFQLNDTKGRADVHRLLSQCHTAKQEKDEALEELKEASELYGKCEDKRSEALTLISMIDLSTQALPVDVLADCWTQRDVISKSYDQPNAEDYRKGDEAVRQMAQAKALFKEIGDEGGEQYVDQLFQANLDNATEAFTKSKDPDVEAVKVNPIDWKTESTICIWMITMPRMLAKAKTDAEKEQAVFRVQRER